jgi:hypothetical protein
MGRMVANAIQSTQSNSLSAPLLGRTTRAKSIDSDLPVEQTPVNVTPVTSFLALIDEARVACGMSQKEMALSAGVNEGQFSLALRGTQGKNFDPRWLDDQPMTYRIALAKVISKKFGVSRDTQRAIVMRRVFAAIDELVALTMDTEVSE